MQFLARLAQQPSIVAAAVAPVYSHGRKLFNVTAKMNVGAAQVDITPPVGVDLSGYAARVQPSTGVLDRLWIKCLYLEQAPQRLLWAHGDVLGFDARFLREFREHARQAFGLSDEQVILSATHTHAGPATVNLTGCGCVDNSYLAVLQSRAQEAAQAAVSRVENCDIMTAEARLDLAIDRRGKPTAHTDPHALAVGFRRTGSGDSLAVLVNYPMHPVVLAASNRLISADWCGATASAISEALEGASVKLVTNGACGNLNPPNQGSGPDGMRATGRAVGESLIEPLKVASPEATVPFVVRRRVVELPLEALDEAGMNRSIDEQLRKTKIAGWERTFREALQTWRRTPKRPTSPIELVAVRIGSIHLLAITGEIFSQFTDVLRRATNGRVYVVGYSNGVFGYVPHAAAYHEGGYEVELAHFFYNTFRARKGGLEMLGDEAAALVQSL